MQGEEDSDETSRCGNPAERAFDLWLQRGLSAVYGDVAAEPIPEALLKLIEQHRRREA